MFKGKDIRRLEGQVAYLEHQVDGLRERVAALEGAAFVRYLPPGRTLYFGMSVPKYAASEVLLAVCQHLGLELHKQHATPEGVRLEPASQLTKSTQD